MAFGTQMRSAESRNYAPVIREKVSWQHRLGKHYGRGIGMTGSLQSPTRGTLPSCPSNPSSRCPNLPPFLLERTGPDSDSASHVCVPLLRGEGG